MKLSQIDENNLNDSLIEKILFSVPKDDLAMGNCILVFGSFLEWKERMYLAIKLYNEGRAPLILVSGGAKEIGGKKEALVMREYAIENGVDIKNILVEDESLNTTENVLCSLLVLHRAKVLFKLKRLLIVSSEHHIRRCMLTLSKYMPRGIQYSFCYSEDGNLGKNNWFKNKDNKEKVYEEVRNMIKYIREGVIDDVDLSI